MFGQISVDQVMGYNTIKYLQRLIISNFLNASIVQIILFGVLQIILFTPQLNHQNQFLQMPPI
jgi:hypothetical protein